MSRIPAISLLGLMILTSLCFPCCLFMHFISMSQTSEQCCNTVSHAKSFQISQPAWLKPKPLLCSQQERQLTHGKVNKSVIVMIHSLISGKMQPAHTLRFLIWDYIWLEGSWFQFEINKLYKSDVSFNVIFLPVNSVCTQLFSQNGLRI